MHKVKVQTVTLTTDPATKFLFPIHWLVMIIICAELFSNLTMQDKAMGQTQFWNNTQTQAQTGSTLYALQPFDGGGDGGGGTIKS